MTGQETAKLSSMNSGTRSHSILCVGHTNWDVVLHTDAVPDPDFSSTIDEDHTSSGGSAANTALALASLDNEVDMLGSIGNDKYGGFVEQALRDGGVSPQLHTKTNSGTTTVYAVITDDADPRYFAKGEDVGEFGIDTLDEGVWDEVDHVHVTSFDREIAGDVAQKASEAGKTVSFNPSQGYGDHTFTRVVDAADVIFLNDREAGMFRDRHTFGEVASETCIVITHGSAGCTAYSPTGVKQHPGFSPPDITDTIGAGDSFVAGFLDEWLVENHLLASLKRGNASGAYAVTCVGAPDSLDAEWVEQKSLEKLPETE